jgi:hypothetical protein
MSATAVEEGLDINGNEENLRSSYEEALTGAPCGLCDEPTYPWEKGVHSSCARRENLSADF